MNSWSSRHAFTSHLSGDPPMQARRTFLALGPPTDVPLGGELEVSGVMMTKFCPDRLLIPHSIGRFYDVLSLTIDGEEQLIDGEVSALAFGDRSMWDVGRDAFDTCPAGAKIVLRVRRNAIRPHSWLVRLVRRWLEMPADPPRTTFTAAMFGTVMT